MFTNYPLDNRNLSDQDYILMLRLYCEHDLTRVEVDDRMVFSRPKVSELLAEGLARETSNV